MHPAAERLASYVFDGAGDIAADELATWLTASPRFRAFAEAHRDKIRKKLRGTTDADARADVRIELRVAYLLLGDRRIGLAMEPAGSTRGGPDFAVTFRSHPAFNLEVTRPRGSVDAEAVGRVVLAKLRQLPPSTPNVLVLAVDGAPLKAAELSDAVRDLRARADAADPILLARGRLDDRRSFYLRFRRLGAVAVLAEGHATAWTNPSARIGVPGRALDAAIEALRERIGG